MIVALVEVDMIARAHTISLQGVEAFPIEVQVSLTSGLPTFTIVGLPDKAVVESRERVRAALTAIGLALPLQRVTINLAPADMIKEGSHFDLPIALAVLAAMGIVPLEDVDGYVALGELGLDGALAPTSGVLPAAVAANAMDKGLICPSAQGAEALWAGGSDLLAASSLMELVACLRDGAAIAKPTPGAPNVAPAPALDLRDVKGQESAKRALEVAAAGGHNLLFIGPPGSGKSMLAARLPGLLPLLTPEEALEVSMVHSVAGALENDGLVTRRPFCDPHHSASVAALIGGGRRARPGVVSLAHHGVLFLDELPEFPRAVLEALRQPLETGRAVVSRANAHIGYPARFQLLAAMNPCRCGHLDDPARACNKAPRCGMEYRGKLSGPLIDRIDLQVHVPAVHPRDLAALPTGEPSAVVATRVAEARRAQAERYLSNGNDGGVPLRNADVGGSTLDRAAALDDAGRSLLTAASEQLGLSARGYHRVLRVARTLADLDGGGAVLSQHLAEALSFRHGLDAVRPFTPGGMTVGM